MPGLLTLFPPDMDGIAVFMALERLDIGVRNMKLTLCQPEPTTAFRRPARVPRACRDHLEAV